MDFAMVPPEINSARMYSGAGAGSILAAAAAWDTLAAELHATGTEYQSLIAELAAEWLGPSATAMTAATAAYTTWMHATAAQAEQTATQAKAAAAAYQAAFAMTVPPPVIAANRSQLTALLATNHLGQNTAAIAATEARYAEMWVQDANAMYTYAGNAATAAILKPFAPAPQTTNPAGAANQAASQTGALGNTLVGNIAGHTQTAIGQLTTVPNALQSLTAPAAAFGTATSASAPAALGLGADPALTLAYLGLASSLFGTFVIDSAGTFGVDVAGSFGIDLIGVGEIGSELLPLDVLAGFTAPVAADVGQAAQVGALSVPPAWTVAAPMTVPDSGAALAAFGAESPGAASPGGAGMPFAEMATAGVAGRAIAAVTRGRGGSGTATARAPDLSAQPAANGPITGIAVELRELAELRDAGILTEEEFTDQKRRLLDP